MMGDSALEGFFWNALMLELGPPESTWYPPKTGIFSIFEIFQKIDIFFENALNNPNFAPGNFGMCCGGVEGQFLHFKIRIVYYSCYSVELNGPLTRKLSDFCIKIVAFYGVFEIHLSPRVVFFKQNPFRNQLT